MEIKSNAPLIASNGLNKGNAQLTQISQSINHSLIENNNHYLDSQTLPAYSPVNIQELNNQQNSSLENNLIGLNQTKMQMLSLMKVLEVEQENFDSSLGKIFDNWV